MKRKIALVLAAAMTVAMLPMNAMAASSNSLGKAADTFKTDEILITGVADKDVYTADLDKLASGEAVTLQVRPNSEVEEGSSIFLTVENGKFDERLLDKAPFQFVTEDGRYTYDQIDADGRSLNDKLIAYIGNNNSRKLPYKYKFINSEQIEVFLCPIGDDKANQNNSDVTKGIPYYNLALPITTEDSEEGAVTVTIDSNKSSISSGSYNVANVSDDDGSTTASVVTADVDVTSNDSYKVPNITIKEDLAGTFDDQTIKVKLNGNYEWKKGAGEIVAGTNCNTDNVATDVKFDGRTLEFTLAGKAAFRDDRISSIIIKDAYADAKDDDTYGDINVTISGDTGITTQTLKVGARADYGFFLKALEEPTTIFAGRTPFDADADIDDFVTAEFEFGETTPGTWLTGRKLELSVPDGVKIVGYEITKNRYMDKFDNATIADDGTTLRFDSVSSITDFDLDDDNASYMDIELYLTTSVDFSGDVAVSVSGAGLDADALDELVVAKVVTPVSVEAATTKSNMGYKAVDTADIVITENVAGALVEGKDVEISLDDTYSNDIAFDDTNAEISVDGELEVKNFDVKNGVMKFTVDSESYNNPSTITISGVSVGTTRSIPYGSYSVIVGGEAIVDNYQEYVNQDDKIVVTSGDITDKDASNDEIKDFDKFEEDGFEFDNYLEIVTDTTTLDGVVKVTIGERSIDMNGEKIDMDAAAYIQESSDSTMVPLRFVTLALGVDQASITDADNSSKIAWDAVSKTATIFYAAGSGQKIIQFQAGSPVMTVDGVAITMQYGVVAEIVDGRMYVPFRALGQALGVPVSWDADTRTAIYNGQLAAADTKTDVEETTEETTAAAEETTVEETTAAEETVETTTVAE